MKSVLISVRPKWCEKIANGEKTIEVRKSAPKEVPFKSYIYCTKEHANEIVLLKDYKNRFRFGDYRNADDHFYSVANGKVIGEFICDSVTEYIAYQIDKDSKHCKNPFFYACLPIKEMCLTIEQIEEYGKGKTLYGWHISNLKIYDKPRELYEFWLEDKCPYATIKGCTYRLHCLRVGENSHKNGRCGKLLQRPPQSWCYVEEEK